MLPTLFSNPLFFLFTTAALVAAITMHEFAHAWMADRLGDPTPRAQGRLTLNPLRHLDPLGTLMLLVTRFGWGKPVEFDPYNLKHPRKDSATIALAGPASNLLTAGVLSLLIHITTLPAILEFFFTTLILFSVTLAIFNLIPIHPLDGGKIAVGFLPKNIAYEWDTIMHKYGVFILIFMLLPFGNSQSPISYLLLPIVDGILKFFL